MESCCCPPTIPVLSPIPAPEPVSCCGTTDGMPRNLLRLESICRVALAAFAYVVNPLRAIYALVVGAAAGAASHLYTIIKTGQPPEEGSRKPVCAQGYMETLSGRTFSPYANQVATALFIAVHIKHYPPFFVPFTALFVGMWASGALISGAWRLLKH